MPWEPLDHTADAGVVVSAADRDSLFAEAVRALTDCITEVDRVRNRERHAIRVSAPDLEQLMVEWLGEALYRFDADGFLAAGARVRIGEEGSGFTLSGELFGESWNPDRHPPGTELKAVTYHGLEVVPGDSGWRARIIFDI